MSPRPAPGLVFVQRSSSQAGAEDPEQRTRTPGSCPPGPVLSSPSTRSRAHMARTRPGRSDSPAPAHCGAHTQEQNRTAQNRSAPQQEEAQPSAPAGREAAGGRRQSQDPRSRTSGEDGERAARGSPTDHGTTALRTGLRAGHPGRVCGHPGGLSPPVSPAWVSPPTPLPPVGPPMAESIPLAPLSSACPLFTVIEPRPRLGSTRPW